MFSAIRTRIRPKSVSTRLTLWYLLTLGASLAALAILVYAVRARTAYLEFDAQLDGRAHQLVSEYRSALLSLDLAGGIERDRRAAAIPFVVREVPGRPLFQSPAFPHFGSGGESQLGAAARSGAHFVTAADRDGVAQRIVTLIVERPGAEALAIQLAAPRSDVAASLRHRGLGMALAIALVLAIAAVGSTVTARRALAPVETIVERARQIQARQLSERLDIEAGSDELDRLVQTLNEMLDRIETSFRVTRRFAADASHELQTPLAAMRAAVEVTRRQDPGAAAWPDMAADVLAEIDRLSALVKDLRLLALADAGYLLSTCEIVDLAAVAADCCEIARLEAAERQVAIDLQIVDRPVIEGSTLHLRRVFLNLVENAIRYSSAGGRVSIRITQQGHHVIASVEDRGCGIDVADLPHVFEPFYRADPARARETGGTGLGLAIADQVVRAHGGRIDVSSQPGAGSTFRVLLPTTRDLQPLPSLD
ncbi:MAG: HAMP domain-containing sensor histidine kinase [Acidobacteriota bacterium]|nr:HAMP domain-containing sensor histidine kinase [Acidobacteriota bacterium]